MPGPILGCEVSMILFEKDFVEQKATVDVTTKNKSFLMISKLLRMMGVINNKFFLAIYNRDLIGVDPFDPNLTSKQKDMIAYECKINPWYYFRECVRVPFQGKTNGGPFKLNLANLALFWCHFNSMDLFLTIPRQNGKTVSTMALMSWFMFIGVQNVKIAMITKDSGLKQDNVSRLKEIRDYLPKYLVINMFKDGDNKEKVEYNLLGNEFRTLVSANSAQRADMQGRGITTPTQHWDEGPFCTNIEISYPIALGATTAARDQLRSLGIPCGIIHTSTAGDPSTKSGKFCKKLVGDAYRFKVNTYDCVDRDELVSRVRLNAASDMIYIEYSFKQLGKSEEWFIKEVLRRQTNTKIEVIARDYFNMWVSEIGKDLLPPDILQAVVASKVEPIEIELIDGIEVNWYVPRSVRDSREFGYLPLIIGTDVSENVGRDFTTFTIINPKDMSVVATFRCNDVNTMLVANMAYDLLKLFPRSVWIPERNMAHSIIDGVLLLLKGDRIDPFTRIYNTMVQDGTYVPNDTNAEHHRKCFGFRTNRTTRDLLYKSVFKRAMFTNKDRIFDTQLANEIQMLTIRNGRIDHAVDGNDDQLISYLLACYFVYFGQNLSKYGIDSSDFESQISAAGNSVDPEIKERQFRIRRDIADLEYKINTTPSAMLRNTYEYRLAGLKREYKPEIVEKPSQTMDELATKTSGYRSWNQITPQMLVKMAA